MTMAKQNSLRGIHNPHFNTEEKTLYPHPRDTRPSDESKMRAYKPGRKMNEQIATIRATKCNDPISGYHLSATAMISSKKGEQYQESQ
jgi:hypothetical protein